MAFLGRFFFDSALNTIFAKTLGDADIYPMRPGHTLLIPKAHVARLADLPPTLGGVMGTALPRVVKAICEGK
jgi:diadenosine tetraphosphate (Ap4A) HIT family hydrolase